MKVKYWVLLLAFLLLLVGCNGGPEDVVIGQPTPDKSAAPTQPPEREGVTILADGVVQAAELPVERLPAPRLLDEPELLEVGDVA